MTVARAAACAVMFLSFTSAVLAQEAKKPDRLQVDDENLLSSLLKEFLFAPPADALRVRVRLKAPGWREKAEEQHREGWLVRGDLGDRVYFTDDEWIPAPAKENIEKVDFTAKWSDLYKGKPEPMAAHGLFFLGEEERPASADGDEPTLVIAAWLYHLGKRELATQVIAHAPEDRTKEVTILKKWLARNALNRMIQCYGQYEDQAALEHGERLVRLYPEEAKQLDQAMPLTEDLRRRKRRGILGAPSTELPADYSHWTRMEKINYLIDALDRTPERVPNRTPDEAYQAKPSIHVTALIAFGELAIPALLDLIEKDERLTRCVNQPWKYHTIGSVQTVREAALSIICRILRTRHLDPRDPDADDYGFGKPDFKKVVPAARAYWKEFGPLPFETRMMRVLTDPKASFPALRDAATKLSVTPGQPEWSWPTGIKSLPPNPVVMKFSQPSAAQAVLAAMDRDLAHDDAGSQADHNRAYHEPVYLSALIRLGDGRIAPVLAERAAKESNALMRVRFAHASFRLGNSQAIIDFAKDFAAGNIALRTDKDGLRWQLEHIVEHLTAVELPAADEALYKLAEPKHRYYQDTINGILEKLIVYGTAGDFVRHPFCIGILRKMLDDSTQTRLRMSYRAGNTLPVAYGGGGSSGQCIAPAILLDPKMRRESAVVRRCDLAGKECGVFAGLPEFHPLLKVADGRLAEIRKAIDKYPGRYRALTPVEALAIAGNDYAALFGPDIAPLERPATAADVKAGKAIFHLDGKGKRANLDLPARGTWPKVGKEKAPRTCLIVQAEVQPSGATVYGVIEHHAIRMVPAEEFADVTPLAMVKVETKHCSSETGQ
jgi:hypothetical protein